MAHKPLLDPLRESEASLRSTSWIAASVLLGIATMAIAASLPAQALLPAISIFMVITGLLSAAILYLAGYRPGTGPQALWEIAALLVFLGCAGTMFATNEQAIALLGTEPMGPTGLRN